MDADVLVPCISKSSAAIALSLYDKVAIALQEDLNHLRDLTVEKIVRNTS